MENKLAHLWLHHSKNHCYVYTYYFTCTGCCRRYSLACKHIYPNGSQDQKHPQRGGCDYCYRLAAKSLWDLELFERSECVKKKQSNIAIWFSPGICCNLKSESLHMQARNTI
jgi:hypothetical protein